ncbi:MAG: DUF5063 domain-containing protein [Saccharofermentanales bacterium]
MINIIERFYNASKYFCDYLTNSTLDETNISELMSLLLNLYSLGLELPDVEPDTIDSCYEDNEENFICKLQKMEIKFSDYYLTMFDPYKEDKPIMGSLYDDLFDIARDLKDGIQEYEKGSLNNAVFEWRFGLNEHWGRHLLGALSALHSLRREYEYEKLCLEAANTDTSNKVTAE